MSEHRSCLLFPLVAVSPLIRIPLPPEEYRQECKILDYSLILSNYVPYLFTTFGGASKRTSLIMCSVTSSVPWPFLQFTNTYGLLPRITLASLSMTLRSAPT